ncbi:MAG: hemerythrin HHE cation-binding protein [Hydrogenophilales bacterium 28-61-23]|nr:MAG: hemerythrin HHE cation-binding protein [Hydrogenophilales bacterium 28-61-23]
MTDITHYLAADHTHCDDLFAEAENAVASTDWLNGQSRFQAYEAATLHHFAREESVLFPAFEARTGMSHGPTAVMRGEHVEMRETLQAMGQAIAKRDADAYLGLSETMLMLMRQHNLKEEQILYPMADQALADTAGEMVRQMEMLAG